MPAVVDRPKAWRRAGLLATVAAHTLVVAAVFWPHAEPEVHTRAHDRIDAEAVLRVRLVRMDRPPRPTPVRLQTPVPKPALPHPSWVAVPTLPRPVHPDSSQPPSWGPSPPFAKAAVGAAPTHRTGEWPSPDGRAPPEGVERGASAPDQVASAQQPQAQASGTSEPGLPPITSRADRRVCPSANYPSSLRSRGIEGTVQLRVQVAPDGRAAAVELLHGSGFRLLDEAALAQARGCRFEPARRGGEPVESWVVFPVHFTLPAAA